MFNDDFDDIWRVLRAEGTVHESMHINVTLVTGRMLPDVRLYDKRITKDDTGTIIRREAVFMDEDGMSVIPLEDIVEMVIL